jgi:hypothetical protein
LAALLQSNLYLLSTTEEQNKSGVYFRVKKSPSLMIPTLQGGQTMSNLKHSISSILSWISLTCTALVLLITGFSLISSNREFMRSEGLDVVVFILMWLYIIFLPIACGLALIVGDRLRTLIRGNFISLAIWIIFIVWTLTMTF